MVHDHPCLDQPILGCDVSAQSLHFFSEQTGEPVIIPNHPKAIRPFLASLNKHCLGVEATGGYEAALMKEAIAQGIRIYRVRGDRVAAHISATGQRAKTDALDAQAITDFVRTYHKRLSPFVPFKKSQTALAKQVARREELVAMRAAEKNRLKAPDYDLCREDIAAHIAFLTQRIEALEDIIQRLINADEELKAKAEILTGIKGIGRTTAATLVATLPELGHLSGKSIASLAGLAPFVRQSGQRSGHRKTGRGRTAVRRILHMATLTAIRWNTTIKTFHDRLIQKGKKHMVAMVACARKLIVIANAKVRDGLKIKQS